MLVIYLMAPTRSHENNLSIYSFWKFNTTSYVIQRIVPGHTINKPRLYNYAIKNLPRAS